ncbi:MAG: hypothetical protein L0211_06410 [Planctomycetaceae bacterium]|nr:hypothetical protein [Planctomycetaceae bacterium]
MLRKITWFLAALFAASFVLLLLVKFGLNPQPGTFELEIASAILQLGVVSVTAAVVSLLTFEYQQERARVEKDRELDRKRLEYREKLLKSTLAKAMGSFTTVKKARRLLRARAILPDNDPTKDVVLARPYDAYLLMLNDAQLELENLARDVETSKPAFTQPDALVKLLWTMEKYLGEILTEYESERAEFRGKPLSRELKLLPRLFDLIDPNKASQFREQLVKPYHLVQKFVRKDLLHPQLPKLEAAGQSHVSGEAS